MISIYRNYSDNPFPPGVNELSKYDDRRSDMRQRYNEEDEIKPAWKDVNELENV